ncbi:AraC family transcriptional regulator [Luteimonas fraxinea]|uniref:AraC family transcriptional regulator n=1 Tax=Luteimonas fraxinea TaxID=2901869 RepID=A0ABS8UB53_9GAMM|nr:AraC family transcriptional regulator [Luteimonas fraxinea]MCD9096735.1 AraC family transcriptional regulator [Luteimonas fraxinea]
MCLSPCPIAIRSYGADSTVDRHDFAQLVLPLTGELAMDIAGREARLDRHVAAFVETGARHDQMSRVENRSIILDLHTGALDDDGMERLARRPYIAMSPDAISLVCYMGLQAARGAVPEHRTRLWMPLLVDALLGDAAGPVSRLARLRAIVEAEPGQAWTVASMAGRIGVSASRLHTLFQQELGQTPRAWLADVRLARARHLLAQTALPIAELAGLCGYADQSALTRAMRRASGTTPALWRRQARARA